MLGLGMSHYKSGFPRPLVGVPFPFDSRDISIGRVISCCSEMQGEAWSAELSPPVTYGSSMKVTIPHQFTTSSYLYP